MNEFERMINSPFFNINTSLSKFFRELKKYHPHFSDEKITKEKLLSIATGGKKYDDKLFRKYLSLLYKHAEDYLYLLDSRSFSLEKDIKILGQLSKRDIKDAFERKLNSIEKTLSEKTQIDVSDYYLYHVLSILKQNHKINYNEIKSKNEDSINSYLNLIYYFLFNSASILSKLESDNYSLMDMNEYFDIENFINRVKLKNQINWLKKFNSPKNSNNNLFLDLLINDLNMNSSDSGLTAYRNLNKLLTENSKRLSRELLFYYFQRMIVFCTLENIKGKYDLTKEIFENYKFQVENNLFTLDAPDNLNFLNFRLIISFAMKNNEFKWTEEFIRDNIHKVKEDSRINILNYAKAVICFHRNEFTESLNFISNIKHELLPISMDVYILKIKIFYNLGYKESVLSIANNFRHFIRNNKMISDYHKITLLNFLKFFKKILRLSSKADKFRLNEVIEQIRTSSDTKERKWMIEIANDLLALK